MAADAQKVEDVSDDRLIELFSAFDHDKSGVLSRFELSNALGGLLERIPTTREVFALETLAEDWGPLTVEVFAHAVRSFDWEDLDLKEKLPDNMTEVSVDLTNLGFTLVLNEDSVKVQTVEEASLRGIVESGDTLVTVNGAPIGVISDLQALFAELSPLRSPLRMTFERNAASGNAEGFEEM